MWRDFHIHWSFSADSNWEKQNSSEEFKDNSDKVWLSYLILAHALTKYFVKRDEEEKCRVWKMLWKCFSMRSRLKRWLQKSNGAQLFSRSNIFLFLNSTARIFLRSWESVKKNVLILSVVELFLAIDNSRSPHFAMLHTSPDLRSLFAFSLVPLFARSTLNPEKNCFSSSAAHFNTERRAKRQQNQFYSRKIILLSSAKNRKISNSITASKVEPLYFRSKNQW